MLKCQQLLAFNIYKQENSVLGLSEPEKSEFLDIFILMTISNFTLGRVEQGKSFITLGQVSSLK